MIKLFSLERQIIPIAKQYLLNNAWEKTPYFLGKYVFELKKSKKVKKDSFLIVINSEYLLYYFYKLSVFLPIGRRIQRKPSKRIRILKTFDGLT